LIAVLAPLAATWQNFISWTFPSLDDVAMTQWDKGGYYPISTVAKAAIISQFWSYGI